MADDDTKIKRPDEQPRPNATKQTARERVEQMLRETFGRAEPPRY